MAVETPPRKSTRPAEWAAGNWMPRSFSAQSKWRFKQHRRAKYALRFSGEPATDLQRVLIDGAIAAEWQALRCEHVGLFRDARIARQALRRALLDFGLTLPASRELRRLQRLPSDQVDAALEAYEAQKAAATGATGYLIEKYGSDP